MDNQPTTPKPTAGWHHHLVRLWCRIAGHDSRWSPDDADDHCRRCGKAISPQATWKQAFAAELQRQLGCTKGEACNQAEVLCDLTKDPICEAFHEANLWRNFGYPR